MPGGEVERLGHDQARDIRKPIERNEEELRMHGHLDVRATVARTQMPTGGAREEIVEVFYLNEDQALLVALFSRTENARKLIEERLDELKKHGEIHVRSTVDRTSMPAVASGPRP